MGVTTKDRSRSRALELSGYRTVNAPETSAPSGDAGVECFDWDQVNLVVSGSANGEADLQVYRRYDGFVTAGGDWIPGEVIPAMTAKAHQYPNKAAGQVIIDTLGADRIQAIAINIPAGVTDLYLKFYGLTKKGEPRISTMRNEQIISTSNFRPVHMQVGHSDFDFVDGGGGNDTLAFTDSADRCAAALTVGAKYHIWSDQDCYVATGGSSVDATSSDYRLNKNRVMEYIPQTGRDYISAIRIATSGNLYISKANSYTAES